MQTVGEMTSKQRVMAVLDGGIPDRMPMCINFWEGFRDQWAKEKNMPIGASILDSYGVEVCICVADETPYPSRRRRVERSGNESIQTDGYGRLLRSVDGAYFQETLEVPIQKPQDLEKNPFDPVDANERYEGFVRKVEENREKKCCFCKVGGPYLRTTYIRGESQFLMDIVADPPFARVLADLMADFLIGIGLESLKRGDLYDTGIWIFDDMAYNESPMFSPESFEKIFLPAYRRMVCAFKEAGARKVILHSDGNILPLLDMLVDAGIDGINPVEPRAGMDVVSLKETYGDSLKLLGGMCNAHLLPNGTPEEIRNETRRILEAGKDGGIVIGTHSIGDDVPVSNFDCFYDTVLQEGRYR